MHELEMLESMWAAKIRRKLDLIVPKVSYDIKTNKGSLNNDNWCFNVSYAFRDALDIKYEERKKNKKPYMVWTQGPILKFKDGDSFISKDNKKALQIKFSRSMGWDPDINEMYKGSVVFDAFDVDGNRYAKIDRFSCDQMEFLKILITGDVRLA